MKYLMQILLGLILLQLLQSCDYSKSRDVLWMKKNFENNAELFFDVTNLFNNSIPINLKKKIMLLLILMIKIIVLILL